MTLSGKRFHHLQEKVLTNGETLSDLDENFEYVEQEIAKFQSRIASEYFNWKWYHIWWYFGRKCHIYIRTDFSLKAQSHSFNEKLSSQEEIIQETTKSFDERIEMLGNIADSRSQTIEEHLNQSSSTIRKSEKKLHYILSKR